MKGHKPGSGLQFFS